MSLSTATHETFSLADSQGRWVLVSTILASSMAFIDGSALNVALDALQKDPLLRASGLDIIWIQNAYLLLLASLILIGGALGDRYGRKRVFGLGIAIFATASLLCGLAPDTRVLIGARALQGLGGALMVPGSLAIIAALFQPSERGRAIGLWSAASTITTVGGPILGGFFVDNLSWRYVFFINLPLAMLALYGLSRFPENRDENAPARLDFLGAGLAALGLAGLTYGLVSLNGGEGGTTTAEAAQAASAGLPASVALAVGIAALIAFVLVELRAPHPMVDPRYFRSRTFTGVNLMTAFLYGALSGSLLFLPLNLTQAQGYDASQAGFVLLPFSLMLAILSPWAGGLLDRYGARLPLTVGPAIVGLSFLLFAANGITGGLGDFWTTFLPPILVLGLGMGITVAPLTASVMSALPADKSGVASGINNAVTRSAQAIAVAIFGAVALSIFTGALAGQLSDSTLPAEAQAAMLADSDQLGNTQPPADLSDAQDAEAALAVRWAFVGAFRAVMLIGAAMCALSAALAFAILRDEPAKSTTS
jgi:EmrB/QacA subfamily drug resistance transporter